MPSSRSTWLVEAALLMKEPDAAVGFVVDHLGSSFQDGAQDVGGGEDFAGAGRRCGCRQGGRHVGRTALNVAVAHETLVNPAKLARRVAQPLGAQDGLGFKGLWI